MYRNKESYFILRIRARVYNSRDVETTQDIFEIRDIRFETEQDALHYIKTSRVKLSNVISLEHRVVSLIDIHEKLKLKTFIVKVDDETFTFNTKKDALAFLQSQTSDRVSLNCKSYEE